MPVMGGRLLAERLMQSYPDVPVLLMSGYTVDELVRRGMLASGTATLLPKPFDPTTLVGRVRALVDSVGGRARG
jgi:CheY-like chemotaxis protein